mgnify:CR=1 FL=1
MADEKEHVSDDYGVDMKVNSNKETIEVHDPKGHIEYDTIEKASIDNNLALSN